MNCPICAKPQDPKFRPFCSARCSDVDLAHWLRGDYRLPVDADENAVGDDMDEGSDKFGLDTA